MIVEGIELDSPFYDRICSASEKIKDAGYQIWLAQQIKDDTTNATAGGKKSVLAHYDYFKSQNKLSFCPSNGERRSIAFMVDRDNDDISGGRRRSPHVIYTEMCDVEAEVFIRGNDSEALSQALSLDSRSADHLAYTLGDWITQLSVIWRDWITWCCIAKATGSRCGVGFGRESQINASKYGPVDPKELSAAIAEVTKAATCDSREVAAKRKRIEQTIGVRHTQGRGASTVKGKWLPFYLLYCIEVYFETNPYSVKGFLTFAAKAYLGSVDFRDGWVKYYQLKLEAVLT
ncbi:hypothetical protein ACIPV3_27025 [Streptomyces albidoflavus]